MMAGAQAHRLPDGRRLHLNHGPIDLIVEALGAPGEVERAHRQAVARFETVLTELVAELPGLRRPTDVRAPRAFAGPTARRMEAAVASFAAKSFITPMAAVAGAVADEVLAALTSGRVLDRAYVNNGGDSALYLAGGQSLTLAIAGTGHGFSDRVIVEAGDGVRGVATSGWRGRSHSLGISDAVTVLASTGAAADAAATMIGNAVDLPGHPAITRQPARLLAPDSDLGERLVTTEVGLLTAAEMDEALARGLAVAQDFVARGLIVAAVLYLGGERVVSGLPLIVAGNKQASCGCAIYPPLACRPSPPQGGRSSASPECIISPLEGEMAGRPEGGAKDRNVARARSDTRTTLTKETHHA